LYQWSNEAAIPVNISLGGSVTSAARLGDTLDVWGTGVNTRLVAGYNTAGAATGYALIDPSLNSITTIAVGGNGDFRSGIAWVDNDTVWGTSGTSVKRSEIS